VNQEHQESVGDAGIGFGYSVMTTPGRKRKKHYYEMNIEKSEVLSPAKHDLGLQTGSSSFEDEIVVIPSQDTQDVSDEECLVRIILQWNLVVSTVNKLASVTGKLRTAVGEDLEALESKILDVNASLGSIPKIQPFQDCISAWDGLTYANHGISNLTQLTETLLQKLEATEQMQQEKIKCCVAECLKEYASKFDKSMIELQGSLSNIADFVKLLGLEQEKLSERILAHRTLDQSMAERLKAVMNLKHDAVQHAPTSNGIDPSITTLQAEMRLLEAQLPSSAAGCLGGQHFQSRADVLLFVEQHIPTNTYYLFHDIATLLESLAMSHIKRKDVLQEWYQSAKVGVNKAVARHMHPFDWCYLPFLAGPKKEPQLLQNIIILRSSLSGSGIPMMESPG
jgi:hypothetical protein